MPSLEVALLGPLDVVLNGHAVTTFAYDKVRALLAYLIVEANRAHNRTALAAFLWPGELENVARKNLRTALATLRQVISDSVAVPSFLIITRNSLQFNRASDYGLDVDVFDELLTQVKRHTHPDTTLCAACASLLTCAVERYRGEFVQGIEVANSDAWEEWVLLMRERLRGQMLDALAQLMEYHESREENGQARHYAWRTLALEVWNEAAHRCLIRIYMRGGQRNAALAHYERCRKVLSEELGIEPATETLALGEYIRAGSLIPQHTLTGALSHTDTNTMVVPYVTPLASASPVIRPIPKRVGNLPAPTASFVGHSDDIATIHHLIRRDDMRLLTLTGPAGTGKTRLALTVAEQLHDAYADGVWFVTLTAVHTAAAVIPTIASVLGVHETAEASLVSHLTRYLQDRQLLLLLDNFEHVLDAAFPLSALLAACPKLKVLVTSRVVLRLYGEWEFIVPPLTVPPYRQQLTQEQALATEAVQLFVARAQAAQPRFTLTDEYATIIGTICSQLDGLPLAIELAAARVRHFSPAELLARLDDRFALLVGGPRDLPTHQQTLHASIAWSYDLLNSNEQQFLRIMSVFVGGWTLEAATGISTAVSGNDDPLWLHETLVAHNLVAKVDDSHVPARFALLETVRAFGLHALKQHDEDMHVQRAHADYYLHLAESAEPELRSAQQNLWRQRLERDHDNIRAALRTFETLGMIDSMLNLCGALGRFWLVHGHFSEGRRWTEAALAHSTPHQVVSRAKALDCLARLAWAQADYACAGAACEESLSLHRSQGNIWGEAVALHTLGAVAGYQSDFARAAAFYTESLALKRTLGDQAGIAVTLNNLAITRMEQGDLAQARLLHEESLTIRRNINNTSGVAESLHSLGDLALREGMYQSAYLYYTESLKLWQSLGDRESIPFGLEGIANATAMRGEIRQAVRLWASAHALRNELGAPLPPSEQEQHDQTLTAARNTIGIADFEVAWEAGNALPLNVAVAEALRSETR